TQVDLQGVIRAFLMNLPMLYLLLLFICSNSQQVVVDKSGRLRYFEVCCVFVCICIFAALLKYVWHTFVKRETFSILFNTSVSRWLSYEMDKGQHMVQNLKRHSDGTFTNDFTHYLDRIKAKDFVEWLANPRQEG
uniref:Glucagon / GIP / secretin / VIP family domain-containing protein n=1 Tax=Amphilophus citrinellus TaxID=61819 RepID=A0A3Q0QRT2_AMPCI